MTAQILKAQDQKMISTNAKIVAASMIVSILPNSIVCPILATYHNSLLSISISMLIPLSIYLLMLTRFIKSGYISIKENCPLFGLNFLVSIILLSGGSTAVYVISALRL